MASDCIFCKIVNGELPAIKLYEDNDTLALLDINPVTKGHTLVIPKQHCDPIMNTPDDVLQKLIVIVRKVARAQAKGLKANAINITQANGQLAGQEIPHIHFHIIPRSEKTGKDTRNWVPAKYANPEEMNQVAEMITGAMET